MTRTDVHRPAEIDPTQYEYVGQECIKVEDFGDAMFIREERERIQAHMKMTGGSYSQHEHGGNCMVCGSVNACYTVLFHHRPTNTYVRMGADCARKCEMGGDFDSNAFRAAAADARMAVAGKKKVAALLADAGLTPCWDIYVNSTDGREELTITDIVGKLVQYGSMSEKQENFMRTLLVRIAKRPEHDALEALAADCPVGRLTIEGEVLTVRVDDGPYGSVTKMLVKHDSGFKVWGTRPSGLNADRGDRVQFTATVERSDSDAKFGFYRRPTKASKVV